MILPRVQTAADPGLPAQAKEVIGFAIGAAMLSGIIVVLRFYTRGVLLRVFGLEDCYLGLAMVSCIPAATYRSRSWADVRFHPRGQLFSVGNTVGMCLRERDPLHPAIFKPGCTDLVQRRTRRWADRSGPFPTK